MKRVHPLSFLFLSLLALTTACSTTGGEKEKIDKPIADTYVPLKGAELNHRYSQEVAEWHAWQNAKAASEAEYTPEPDTISTGSSIPEDRIHEPTPVAPQKQSQQLQIEEDENSLRIRD
jgi:hypothetical protein